MIADTTRRGFSEELGQYGPVLASISVKIQFRIIAIREVPNAARKFGHAGLPQRLCQLYRRGLPLRLLSSAAAALNGSATQQCA